MTVVRLVLFVLTICFVCFMLICLFPMLLVVPIVSLCFCCLLWGWMLVLLFGFCTYLIWFDFRLWFGLYLVLLRCLFRLFVAFNLGFGLIFIHSFLVWVWCVCLLFFIGVVDCCGWLLCLVLTCGCLICLLWFCWGVVFVNFVCIVRCGLLCFEFWFGAVFV